MLPMLPAKGPWPHPYYELEDQYVNVAFEDTDGRSHTVPVRQKTTGEGPPLVLIHGLMTSSYSFRYVLEPLAKRYRLFVPDLVGAGASGAPLDLVYSLDNVARFITAYVKKVTKETPYVIGNSLGGLYTLNAILQEDDAGRPPLARRFVLAHSPGYPFFRTKLLNAGMKIGLARLTARVSHSFARTFVAKNVHYAREDMMSEEEVKEYGRIFQSLDGARVFAKILAESIDPADHNRVIAKLRDRKEAGKPFPCPVQVLYARKDPMVPPEFGPLYHADIPGSELVWMEGVSHFMHVDGPEATVAHWLEFDKKA